MVVTRGSQRWVSRAVRGLPDLWTTILALLIVATPSIVRGQCADYGTSFRFLGTEDLPDYGNDVAVDSSLAFVVSSVLCSSCIGRLDILDVSMVGSGGAAQALAGIELTGGPARVVVQGQRAYVGTLDGHLHVVGVSDPSDPILISTIPIEGLYELAVAPGILYAATDSGLHIYELSNPNLPTRVGGVSFAGGSKSVAISDGLAFVAWGGFAEGGSALSVVDVSEPAQPQVLSSLWSSAKLFAVAASGSRVYLGGGFRYQYADGFLDVIDVSDPAHPVLIGSLDDLRFPINGLAINGTSVFATAADPWYFYGNFYAIDATDPSEMNVVYLKEFEFEAYGPCVADGIVFFCEHSLIAGLNFAIAPDSVQPKSLANLSWSGEIESIDIQASLGYLIDSSQMLRVLDLSDPTNPQILGSVYTPTRGNVLEVQGDYAYVGYATRSLDVVDVSNPQSPQIVASVPPAFGVNDIMSSGSWLYTVGENGLWAIDLSNPGSPAATGYLAIDGIRIVVEGTHAYVLDGYTFHVVDLVDPATPILVGNTSTEAARALDVAGRYAFVVDWEGVQIIDVIDPALPIEVGRIQGMGELDPMVISVEGDYVYLARDRMAVIDIRNPLQPVLLGESEMEIEAWPRGVASSEDLVLIAGENLRVFPVQCARQVRVGPRVSADVMEINIAPNPMRTETRLRLELDRVLRDGSRGPIRVSVVDVAGRRVARLVEESLGTGPNEWRWDGRRDWDGRPASAGIYWIRIDVPGLRPQTARIVRLQGD